MVSNKLAVLALALVGSVVANPLIQARATCNADNCARAVTGTRLTAIPAATRSADCSKFQAVTVSYDPFQGQTITTSLDNPESLPTYAASQCQFDVRRYDSACSCYGVPRATTTTSFPCVGGQVVTDPQGTCTFTQKCYTSISGNLLTYDVGQGYYGECLTLCDQTPGCVAVQFGYYDGFCAVYGTGYTLTNVGKDLQSAAYIKKDTKCGAQLD